LKPIDFKIVMIHVDDKSSDYWEGILFSVYYK